MKRTSLQILIMIAVVSVAGTMVAAEFGLFTSSFSGHQVREHVNTGIRIEMRMPRIDVGDDAAVFEVSLYDPHDPVFEGHPTIASARLLVDGVPHTMIPAPPGSGVLWKVNRPTGWTFGVNEAAVETYDGHGGLIFGTRMVTP